MPDTLKSWLYEHRNKLIVGTILTFVAALLTIPTHLAQNLVDRFYPPSNTPAATSTSTPIPTKPLPHPHYTFRECVANDANPHEQPLPHEHSDTHADDKQVPRVEPNS